MDHRDGRRSRPGPDGMEAQPWVQHGLPAEGGAEPVGEDRAARHTALAGGHMTGTGLRAAEADEEPSTAGGKLSPKKMAPKSRFWLGSSMAPERHLGCHVLLWQRSTIAVALSFYPLSEVCRSIFGLNKTNVSMQSISMLAFLQGTYVARCQLMNLEAVFFSTIPPFFISYC